MYTRNDGNCAALFFFFGSSRIIMFYSERSIAEMGSSIVNDVDEARGLSIDTLNTLRGILISSLSRENVPFVEELSEPSRRKVTFTECRTTYRPSYRGKIF